jgi:hypothetical protein
MRGLSAAERLRESDEAEELEESLSGAVGGEASSSLRRGLLREWDESASAM